MTIDHHRMRDVADAYTNAWNSGSAEALAGFYAQEGRIVINRGQPWEGRAGVAQMAAAFFADVPDLKLVCDGLRVADDDVVYLWTGNPLRVAGWEEWDMDADHTVKASRGRHDADDYARQTRA